MESANIIICCDQVWLSWKKGRKENVWRETKMFCQMCCLLGGEVLRISEDLGQRSPGAIGCTCDVAISQLGVNVRGVAAPPCSVGCASPGSQHHQSAFCVSRLSENLSWVCLRFFSFGQFPHILSPPPRPPPPRSRPVTSHFTFVFWLQSFSPSIILIVSVGGRVFYSHPLLFRHRGTNFIWPFFVICARFVFSFPNLWPLSFKVFLFCGKRNTNNRLPAKQRRSKEPLYVKK